MIRLFVAIEFPVDIRDRLAGLGGGVPGARWVDADNLHLTVRFVGDVDNTVAADIDAVLAEVRAPAFDLVLDGVGQFGTGNRPRVLWAGIERNPALGHLYAKVESALVRAGLPRDDRKFSPHVTLARLKEVRRDRVGRFLAERGLFRAGPFAVRHFTLFESRLGRGGPIYSPLRRYDLTPAEG